MPLGAGYGAVSGVHLAPAGGFAVLSVSPPSGDTAGSTPIVIQVTDSTGVVSGSLSGRPLTGVSIADPTHVNAITPAFTFPSSFSGVRSIAFNGTHIWVASTFDDRFIYKVDITLTQPSVVAKIDLSDYGFSPPSAPTVDARQIRAHGNYIFVCIQANNNTVDPGIYNGFCVILDKDTDQVVGHVALALPGPVSAQRAADCRAVTFDGSGNFFVGQTPSSSGPAATFIRKYSIAAVVAAYPSYGTSTMDVQLTNPFIEDIDYGGGHIWVVGGQKQTFFGSGTVTRIDAVTGAEVFYTYAGIYANWSSFTVKFTTGKVLTGSSPGTSTTTPILTFNPNTFPSDPTPVSTLNSMNVSGGMAFGQDTDTASYWFGGYQSGFHAWKFNSDDSLVATVNCSGRPSDFAFDGTKLWVALAFQGLVRIDVTPGSEIVDYSINSGQNQATGTVDVTLTNATTSDTLPNGYSYAAVPVVLGIVSNQGAAAGGDFVTIQVDSSVGVTGAAVGGVPLSGFAIVDGTHVSGITGAHALGIVSVSATNGAGTGTLANSFLYVALVVQAVVPNNGDKAGGTFVIIQVDNSAGATGATVGGVALTGFSIVNGTHVSGTTGAHAVGFADVTVTNNFGSASLFSGYSYTGLAVSAIVPSTGSSGGGTAVTVSVSSTTGVTSVSVGGVNLTSFLITGPTTITGVTAAHAAGAVDVGAVNGAGPGDSLIGGFTYIAPADLSTLNLTMRFAAGASIVPNDQTVYDLPTIGFPASPVRVSYVWFGTASAGNSVHREVGNLSWDFNPTVGGVQPMHTGSLGGLATVKRTTGDTGLNVDRLDATIPAGNNVANIYGASEGFLWILVKTPASIDPGDWSLVGAFGGLGAPEVALNGDAGPVAKFTVPSYINGTTADHDQFPITTPVALNTWMVIMARYNGPATTKEIRVNQGPWTSGFIYNLSHTQDGQAVSVALPMPLNTELADIGSQQTTVSDAMADSIYFALQALYPAAGLP